MNKYIYWDNSKYWKGNKLAEIEAQTITDADKLFEQQMSLKLTKCSYIGCSIECDGYELDF